MRDLKMAAALAAVCLAVTTPLAAQQTDWSVQYTEPGNISLAVSAVDHDHAYIAGGKDGVGPRIGRTSDGGQTWNWSITDVMSMALLWLDLEMVDANTGFAAGVGVFASGAGKSTDGGNTWTPIVPTSAFNFVNAWECVFALDEDLVWFGGLSASFIGEQSGVARSVNGGLTFEFADTSAEGSWPHDLHFIDAQTGWLASGEFPDSDTGQGQYYGVIQRTDDGGKTWAKQFDVDGYYFTSIHFTDAWNGWAVAQGDNVSRIYHSTDGGANWTQQSVPATGVLHLAYVEMFDPLEGWVIGWEPLTINPGVVLYHTVDGGANWAHDPFGPPYGPIRLDMVDSTKGWTVGANNLQVGAIMVYDSGGPLPPPVVTGVLPIGGPPAGGQDVTIQGANFTSTSDTTVAFGGQSAAGFTVTGTGTIQALTPGAAEPGPVSVTVQNANGSDTLENAYFYLPAVLTAGSGAPGSNLDVLIYGGSDEAAFVLLGFVPTALPTSFGTLYVDPTQAFMLLGPFDLAAGGGQAVLPLSVPNDPNLSGQTAIFQALAGSLASGTAAFSNAASVAIP